RGGRGSRDQPRRAPRARDRGHPARPHGAAPPRDERAPEGRPRHRRRLTRSFASSGYPGAVRPRAVLVLFALAATLLAPAPAIAAMAPALVWGDRGGTIVPEGSTRVRIDHEALDFAPADRADRAQVTARYTMTNTSALVESTDVAFVFVRGEARD